jgi:hypothetical protein
MPHGHFHVEHKEFGSFLTMDYTVAFNKGRERERERERERVYVTYMFIYIL